MPSIVLRAAENGQHGREKHRGAKTIAVCTCASRAQAIGSENLKKGIVTRANYQFAKSNTPM